MNSQTIKTGLLLALCGTITAFAVELPINGKFAKDDKGQLFYWRPSIPRKTVSIEVIPASDKKNNAILIENDNKSYGISSSMIKITAYKTLHFSIHVRGNGGFAAQLNYYTEKGKYIGTKVFFEGRASNDAFQKFKGSLDIPETLNDKKVAFAAIKLLTFKNTQLIFENAVLSADER